MNIRDIFESRKKLKPSQYGRWFFSLENLLNSGIPLMQALESMKKDSAEGGTASQVKEHIAAGDSLRTSMEKTGVFEDFALAIVESGEQSGDLTAALETLRCFYMQRESFRRQLMQAMYYPLLVLGCLFFLMLFLIFHFVPSLARLYGEAVFLGEEKAFALIRGFLILREYFLPILCTGILFAVFFRHGLGLLLERRSGYPLLYILPVAGGLFRRQKLGEIIWSVSIMLECGLDILRTLEVVGRNQHNPKIKEQIRELMRQISEGKTLEESLGHLPLKDEELKYFVALGEASGDLAGKIGYLAERYKREVESRCLSLSSMAQPAAVLLLTAAVGLLMIGIVLPLLDAGTLHSI